MSATRTIDRARILPTPVPRLAGFAAIALSVLGLLVGLIMVQDLSDDLTASMEVTRSAVDAIQETVLLADSVTDGTSASLEAASASVASVSATVDTAVLTLENVATFLETDLPDDLEAVRRAMPAAVQAADAIDTTLSALSLFGVDYNPDQPFGDSLRDVENALTGLPEELRVQSEALRLLVPSAEELSNDTAQLSSAMERLSGSLEGFRDLTTSYQSTLDQASETIDETNGALGQRAWLLRAAVIIAALVGIAVGWGLVRVSDALEALATAPAGD